MVIIMLVCLPFISCLFSLIWDSICVSYILVTAHKGILTFSYFSCITFEESTLCYIFKAMFPLSLFISLRPFPLFKTFSGFLILLFYFYYFITFSITIYFPLCPLPVSLFLNNDCSIPVVCSSAQTRCTFFSWNPPVPSAWYQNTLRF